MKRICKAVVEAFLLSPHVDDGYGSGQTGGYGSNQRGNQGGYVSWARGKFTYPVRDADADGSGRWQ